jgi:small subunit ribosomal protein S6
VTLPAPTYDLVLLLDTQAEDAARSKIVADARSSIEAQGELLRHDEWGERPLSYPINRHNSAEYHLFQFHASDAGLLNGLDRTLRITDGVMRFRLIKLRPGVPEAPDMGSSATPPARRAEGEPAMRAAPSETEGEAAPAPASAETAPASAATQAAPASAEAAPASAPAEAAPTSAEAAPAEPAAVDGPAGAPEPGTDGADEGAAQAQPPEPDPGETAPAEGS